jgi:hypothetical protein
MAASHRVEIYRFARVPAGTEPRGLAKQKQENEARVERSATPTRASDPQGCFASLAGFQLYISRENKSP